MHVGSETKLGFSVGSPHSQTAFTLAGGTYAWDENWNGNQVGLTVETMGLLAFVSQWSSLMSCSEL